MKFRGLICLACFLSGTTRNRTGDTRIFSPLLYQLSYGTIPIKAVRSMSFPYYRGAKVNNLFLICKCTPQFFHFFAHWCPHPARRAPEQSRKAGRGETGARRTQADRQNKAEAENQAESLGESREEQDKNRKGRREKTGCQSRDNKKGRPPRWEPSRIYQTADYWTITSPTVSLVL